MHVTPITAADKLIGAINRLPISLFFAFLLFRFHTLTCSLHPFH